MKLMLFLFTLFGMSFSSMASRNLILSAQKSTFEYKGGYKLSVEVSSDGARLASVKLFKDNVAIAVPVADLDEVLHPVINSISVAGGVVASDKMEVPKFVSVGFGAAECESGKCPRVIIFRFEDGQYAGYVIIENN